MTNNEIYESYNGQEGLKLPSYMGIFARDNTYHFSAEQLREDLSSCKELTVKELRPIVGNEEAINLYKGFDYEADIDYKGVEYTISIYALTAGGFDLSTYAFANMVDEESLEQVGKQDFMLSVKLWFSDDPMESYLLQLKVLYALMPKASLVVDFSAYKLLSPYWLSMSAASDVPPAPDYLYIVHAVYNDLDDDQRIYWLHSHGLHRCGSVDLEMVNIKSGAQEMYSLLTNTANMFIVDHFKENEIFQVDYDGLGINLCWLRWEDALKGLPEDMLGGLNERMVGEEDEENDHAGPSGVLLAVEDGNYSSPEIYGSTIADNPIFYIKTEETIRMRELAKERFHFFEEVFQKYGVKEAPKKSFIGKLLKKEAAESGWRFLVKIGLLVDEAETENDMEHLWFEVMEMNGDKVTVKLLNQPYWIKALNENDIKTYPIMEVLTDWVIYGPETSYSPDNIYQLVSMP